MLFCSGTSKRNFGFSKWLLNPGHPNFVIFKVIKSLLPYKFRKKCQKCYKMFGTDFKTSKFCLACSNYKRSGPKPKTHKPETATQGKEEGLDKQAKIELF
jgi:hypothetical protein